LSGRDFELIIGNGTGLMTNRNRRGSALSELANEASWLVATLVWLLV
jgi:hypothetical protein